MKHLYFCTLLFWGCIAFGQTEEKVDSIIDDEMIFSNKPRPFVGIEFGFGALCNSISTSELINFTSTDFLENEDKDRLMSSINGPLRYGYTQRFKLEYQQPGYRILDIYKRGQGFSIENKYYNSARISHNLLELILYGNKPYAGKTLELGKTRAETWYYTSLSYHFDVMLDSLQPINITVGLNVGHDYSFYLVRQGDLYTEPDGTFLDLDVDYRMRDRILEAQPIAGLGLSVGAEAEFRLSPESSIQLSVEDLGFIVWTGGRSVDADSTFRFEGLEFQNILDINDSLAQVQKDEYDEAFYYNEEGSYARLTPFRIGVQWYHKNKAGRKFKGYSVAADYRYIAGYYPKLSLGAHFKTGYKQELVTALTTGGYNLASLDLAYEITFARNWTVNLAISNFSGLVVPIISGGAYGVLGVKYEL